MNPQDPLANLQPLRPADALSWWPLAPGWWLLLILLLAVAGLTGTLLWRRHRRNRYRRVALQQLAEISHDFTGGHQSEARLLGEVNSLLKAVVLRSYPTGEMASVTGERWLQFLNAGLEEGGSALRFPAAIGQAAYTATPSIDNVDEMVQAARAWLRLHRVAQ